MLLDNGIYLGLYRQIVRVGKKKKREACSKLICTSKQTCKETTFLYVISCVVLVQHVDHQTCIRYPTFWQADD
jgi:hypothetical protein